MKNEDGKYLATEAGTYNYDHHHYCCGVSDCEELHGVWYLGEHTYDGSEECSCGGHAAVKIIPKSGNERFFSSLAAACEEFTTDDSYIQMLAGTTEPGFTIDKNIYLDLNGQDVTISEGELTISDGYTLYGMDTATNAFTSNDTDLYGEIIGSVSGDVAEYYQYNLNDVSGKYYVASTKDNKLSFHRFDMGVTDYTFYGSGNTGVLAFNIAIKGDNKALEMMQEKGVQLNGNYQWQSGSGLETVSTGVTLTGRISPITNFTETFNVNAAVKLANAVIVEQDGKASGISFQSAVDWFYNKKATDTEKLAIEAFADGKFTLTQG